MKNIITFISCMLILSMPLEMMSQLPVKDTKLTTPQGYSPSQDSAYKKAIELNIPPEIRFLYDMELTQNDLHLQEKNSNKNIWMQALQDLHNRYPNLFQPTSNDMVQQYINTQNSMYVPYVKTISSGGVQIPLKAIAQLLGIAKDNSPILEYELEYPAEVEVVIYNMSGIVIVTLANERQPAGKYTYVWDYRDEEGQTVSNGAYIGEIRIGTTQYIRKTILKK